MKKSLAVLLFVFAAPFVFAQGVGNYGPGQVCGNSNAAASAPCKPVDLLFGRDSTTISSATSLSSTACGRTTAAGGSAAFYTVTLGPASGFVSPCTITIVNTDSDGKQLSVNGLTNGGFGNVGCGPGILCPTQAVEYTIIASAWVMISGPGPWTPAGNVLVYVNASSSTATCGPTGALTCAAGNDANDGLSYSSPLNTNQQAVTNIYSAAWLAGATPIISDAHGASQNYAFTCASGSLIGNGGFFVEGDSSAPTAVQIQPPASKPAIGPVTDLCTVSIQSLKLVDNASSNGGALLSVTKEGQVDLRGVTLGACNSTCTQVGVTGAGAVVNVLGVDGAANPNQIVGGAAAAFSSSSSGQLNFAGQTVSIPLSLAYSGAFGAIDNGFMIGLTNATFSGAGVSGTTGTRCSILGTASGFDAGEFDPNIVFPGNANCIPQNGYPETWTPTFVGTGGGTATYAATCGTSGSATCQIGTVTVLNGLVHVSFKIITASLSGVSGSQTYIGVLPIAPGTTQTYGADDEQGCSLARYAGWTGDSGYTSLSAGVVGGELGIFLYENGSGHAGQNAPVSDFSSPVTIVGTCVYHQLEAGYQ